MRKLLLSLFASALSCTLVAQITPQHLRERVEQGLGLWDLEWKVDDLGQLRILPAPFSPDSMSKDDEWLFAFPPQANGLDNAFHNLGLLGFLNLLLAGPRDLASLADAEQDFRKLGLDLAPAALRLRAITPVTESKPHLRRRAELDRILAVRLLQQGQVHEAMGELKVLAEDVDGDPFLRAAAEDARLALAGTKPGVTWITAELSTAMARVPRDADLVFFIDQHAIPPAFFMPRLSRQMASEMFARILMDHDTLSPPELTQYQMITEFPSLLPYEIARRFGNLRLDWMLGAVRVDGISSVPLWLEGHGMFEVERIRAGLQNAGIRVEVESDHIATDELPFGISMRLDREAVRLHQADFTANDNDDKRAGLLEEGLGGGAAIWIHAGRGSALLAGIQMGPMQPVSATMTVSFEEGMAVTLSTEHADATSARSLERMLEGLRGQGIGELQRLTEDGGESVALARAVGILKGAIIELQGVRLELRASLGALTLEDVPDLVRCLGLR